MVHASPHPLPSLIPTFLVFSKLPLFLWTDLLKQLLPTFPQFVRTHEKALANALQLRQRNAAQTAEVATNPLSAPQPASSASSVSSALVAALSFGALNFTSQSIKPAKLTLTPHHLFYLLSRFEEIGVPVGPLNVRTENLHAEASPANYVSFLGQSQRSRGRSDRDSIHSVTSVRSVMSGMSALWSGWGTTNSNAKSEKAQNQLIFDLKYLYSAFTKIPCLRLSPDRKARLIRGYEEFPFDTAVPLHSFKNLSALDVCDVDFRHLFGWDKLADQLRSLTMKRANVNDPVDVLTNIVLDDMDKRRRRSSKAQSSPVLSWPLSPPVRSADITRVASMPSSPAVADKLGQSTGPNNEGPPAPHSPRSSPTRPKSSKQNVSFRHVKSHSTKIKRSGSGSSDSSAHSNPPSVGAYRSGSSSNLLLTGMLPASKWRFLRHLGLSDNALTSIPVNSLAPLSNNLHSLDLSSNLFTDVPDGIADLVALRALNLSNCMVRSLQSLLRSPLPAIATLNLRDNRLQSLAGIERLLSLERLDLRDNKLVDPAELARLTGLPDFREVWVMQNPFTKSYSNYRITIFNLFRSTPGLVNDVLIDGSSPAYSERKHLFDRVQEIVPVSVVKTIRAQSDGQTPADNGDERDGNPALSIDPETGDRNGSAQAVHQDQQAPGFAMNTSLARSMGPEASDRSAARSKRFKKGTRRQRLVDLAADEQAFLGNSIPAVQPMLVNQNPKEQMATINSDDSMNYATADSVAVCVVSPYYSGLQAQPFMKEGLPTVKDDTLDPLRRNRLTPNGDQSLGVTESQNTRLRAQTYRHKVETLKQEVGSNWLSALSDEGWINDKKTAGVGMDASALRRTKPELSLLRAQTSGIT
ncbi:MAG: hypothetical protein Q9218_000913 [Villophora microphyllina]